MKGGLLFLKSRSAGWALVLSVAVVALVTTLADQPTSVPLRDHASVIPQLVLGGAPATAACLAMRPPGASVEGNPQIIRRCRAVWWLLIAGLLVMSAALGGAASGSAAPWALGRNIVLLVALATLAGIVVGHEFGWTLPLVVVGVTVMFGTSSFTGLPHDWALLAQPASGTAAAVITAGSAVLAWLGYAFLDVAGPGTSWQRLIAMARFH